MGPLIKKEIRLVLPAWILAMFLAIIPAWIAGSVWNLNDSVSVWQSGFWLEAVVPVIFSLGLLLLGLSPFGQEFSQGTFTILLSQPAERSRIWRTKLVILGLAFLTAWLAAVVSLWFQFLLYDDYMHTRFAGDFGDAVVFLTVSVL